YYIYILSLHDALPIFSEYYKTIMNKAASLNLPLKIHTKPQEMETKTNFENDHDHAHYDKKVAKEILQWFQFAWDVERQFIAAFRQRKVYPGLFWGTFDVSGTLIYNKFDPFSDDTRYI